jgi:hypothetical protein
MQIMQSLGVLACDKEKNPGKCPARSVFAIGSNPPSWDPEKAPYVDFSVHVPVYPKKWIWVPAHDPGDHTATAEHPNVTESELAKRDEFMFFTLYKLYQMSLVDTSKLVTGPIPITISK